MIHFSDKNIFEYQLEMTLETNFFGS